MSFRSSTDLRRKAQSISSHAPALGVWLLAAAAIAVVTTRDRFWYVMTDELLYERLAISVNRLHSPLPHIHGELIANVNQLYPILLAPVFRHDTVGADLHSAHILNSVLMTSVAVPAYFLARRLMRSTWVPVLVALLTVTVPWIVLSSFLLTEIAAYPAFVLALLACHVCAATPSRRNDLLAIAALVAAVLARTQLVVLVFALPLTIVSQGLGTGIRAALRAAWERHRLLWGVYAVGALVTVGLVVTGHHPLGTYSQTTSGNLLPHGILQQVVAHLAAVATGIALLPFVLGGAWLVGTVARPESDERRTFALLGTTAIVLFAFEAASFDIRFAGGLVHERYLFYVAPILFVGFGAALTSDRRPRWSLAVPTALLVWGFLEWDLPVYEKLNVDTPASMFDNYLYRTLGGAGGARATLIAAAILAALVAFEATALLSRSRSAALLAGIALLVPAEGAYAFKRLFDLPGPNGYPLTLDQSGVYGWVDRAIGPSMHVTMVPYPMVPGDFWAGVSFSWDLEFWNKSVERDAVQPGTFEWTPKTFPKLYLRFDRTNGLANASPPTYVAQSITDVRFHIVGKVVYTDRGMYLVQPERPWRTDWLAEGLYDDGWTRPATPGRIRVFPLPGQSGGVTRTIQISLQKPGDIATRPYVIKSNLGAWQGTVGGAQVDLEFPICVPQRRPAEATLTTPGQSPIYGDPKSQETFALPRAAGLLFTKIHVSGAGDPCSPG